MLWILAMVLVRCGEAAQPSCKDMAGKDVDWFAAVKLPANVDEMKGRTFMYVDSRRNGWVKSDKPINSTTSAIGATVKQLYDADKKQLRIAYNDDVPQEIEHGGNRGHTKGVLVFSNEKGFWLIHSVPRFPPLKNYYYPDSGSIFAQSFLCLSLNANVLEKVSQYLRYSQVTPFIINVPKIFEKMAPYLKDVKEKKSLDRGDTELTTVQAFDTVGHQKVVMMAKHKKFGKDLWHDLIAPFFKTSIAVETWRNGAAKNVGSQCEGKTKVYDIKSVKLSDKTYSSSKDHSKWGVSMSNKVPIVCIGDVNRQESQFKRGGGAVCIKDEKLWKTFRTSVDSLEECSITVKKKSS